MYKCKFTFSNEVLAVATTYCIKSLMEWDDQHDTSIQRWIYMVHPRAKYIIQI